MQEAEQSVVAWRKAIVMSAGGVVLWCGGKQDRHLGKQQRACDYLMVAISDVHQTSVDIRSPLADTVRNIPVFFYFVLMSPQQIELET